MNAEKKKMRISRIHNGTVIDHIRPGSAVDVFQILGLREDTTSSITLAIRVDSDKMGKKDLLKIEDRFLTPRESAMVALIAPNTTINIIRSYEVESKRDVELPDVIEGTVQCGNPNCITNAEREPVEAQFVLVSEDPLGIRCRY
ncbi:MAG: aspartate carbamoyltransferase regulatory subunit, partial [Candidatus Bipolaricaulota bacterium]